MGDYEQICFFAEDSIPKKQSNYVDASGKVKSVVDDNIALVIMSGKESKYMGVLFVTDIKGAMAFCSLPETRGRGRYGGEWACFFTSHDIDEHDTFINDNGKFDSLIAQHGINIVFRVAKKGGGKTKVENWREKINQFQNQSQSL